MCEREDVRERGRKREGVCVCVYVQCTCMYTYVHLTEKVHKSVLKSALSFHGYLLM